ncbi:MAG: insulinase family protein [Bryobacterales bacterium]|nr:insulinase family protein [Bryobacterales bacterium]
MKPSSALLALAMSLPVFGDSLITQPGKSPLVTIRVVFKTGAAHDPKGKEGLAALTTAMMADGGTRKLTYQQIIDALFPMAVDIRAQVDKEMITFSTETHVDNLEKFYPIFRDVITDPGWRAEDLTRLKDDAVNAIRTGLRGNNDEELGKEVLYEQIYAGRSYGHLNRGHVSAIQSITLDDIKLFHKQYFTATNYTIAVAGGYPPDFPARLKADLDKLPKTEVISPQVSAPLPVFGRNLVIVDKPTRSVAMSLGKPIAVKRGDPDYVPLLIAQSWLGQHRSSGVRLFERIREIRGLNYGDYAYIEYFPRGMYQFDPDPNLARQQQIFQIWIRPVQPNTAVFTLRLAIYEWERLIKEGMTEADFERTRNFLSKYVNLLTKTKSAELGYAIDSDFYGTTAYNTYIKNALRTVTLQQVNRAIRKHLTPDNIQIVLVSNNAQQLKDKLLSGDPSPMTYNSPKPEEIQAEDKIIEKLDLGLRADKVKILDVKTVFE